MATHRQVDSLKPGKLSFRSKVNFMSKVYRFSHPDYPFTENDVCLAFGCSGALFNAISVLCESGDNMLVPRPGFPLALPIAQNLGINIRFYDLLPEKGW